MQCITGRPPCDGVLKGGEPKHSPPGCLAEGEIMHGPDRTPVFEEGKTRVSVEYANAR